MRMLMGLGNPGSRYAGNRHNIGWMALDAFARKYPPETPWRMVGDCAWACSRCVRDGRGIPVVLVKPLAYMNCSGSAFSAGWPLTEWAATVAGESGLGGVSPGSGGEIPGAADWSGLLVLVDEVLLPLGRVRLRGSGSDGGHNGLSDLIDALDTDRFARLRIGVGACPAGVDLKDWVLADFFPEDRVRVARVAEWAAEAAEAWLFDGVTAAQSRYNGALLPEEDAGLERPTGG